MLSLEELPDGPSFEFPKEPTVPPIYDDMVLAEQLASVEDPFVPKIEAPTPQPTTESLNPELLLSAMSSLSDEALDEQVKQLCGRRRRSDEALAALVYEKNLRLATAGREGEFSSWLAHPDIDLPRQTAYDMVRRHADRNGLALPWELKTANRTGSYDSADFNLNEHFGNPVSDPQAQRIRAEVQTQQARRLGLEKSRIVRIDIVAETAQQKEEVKSGLKELGSEAAPQIHRTLHPFRFMLQLVLPDYSLSAELERRSIYEFTRGQK
jgi:hypothetical protein